MIFMRWRNIEQSHCCRVDTWDHLIVESFFNSCHSLHYIFIDHSPLLLWCLEIKVTHFSIEIHSRENFKMKKRRNRFHWGFTARFLWIEAFRLLEFSLLSTCSCRSTYATSVHPSKYLQNGFFIKQMTKRIPYDFLRGQHWNLWIVSKRDLKLLLSAA